jgi:hypothetical protein
MGLKKNPIFYDVEIIVRDDAKHLRTELQNKVSNKISMVKNAKKNSRRSNR